MIPAPAPRDSRSLRVLVVDAGDAPPRVVGAPALTELFSPGDLLVVNDAATLPAAISAVTAGGEPVEVRLAAQRGGASRFTAVLFGAGDYRTPTEHRPAPPRMAPGASLAAGAGLRVTIQAVSAASPRLVAVELSLDGEPGAAPAEVWAALYRAGRPVQYAHVAAPLELWDVQNVYAGRPWAVEMPSAGRAIDVGTLARLRARGVRLASVTHAAGLSATGDPAIDALLPLPERWNVSAVAASAVAAARRAGGRVVAIGTSVVRALEAAARTPRSRAAGRLAPGEGITDLRVGPATERRVVDAVLTGVHEADTTHFALLGAFADRSRLAGAELAAERAKLLGHEFGDAWLVWGAPRRARAAITPASAPRAC